MIDIVKDLDWLRQPCLEVDDKINVKAIAAALLNTLFPNESWGRVDRKYYQRGAGLAANQIGLKHRVCLIASGQMNPLILVNPVIVKAEGVRILRIGNTLVEEGCLSLPGVEVSVERPTFIKVKCLDVEMQPRSYKFRDLEAICACHEIDHLNGILMIDHLPPDRREFYERLLRK